MYSTFFILAFLCLLFVLAFALSLLKEKADARREEPVFYDRPDFRDRAGFWVTATPANSIIRLKQSSLLHSKLAQLEFAVDPYWTAILRICRSGENLHLEDFTQQYEEQRIVHFDGIRTLVEQSPGQAALASWSRDGFDYALYYPETEMSLMGGTVYDFVTRSKAENG